MHKKYIMDKSYAARKFYENMENSMKYNYKLIY